jgi:hypothetical protein
VPVFTSATFGNYTKKWLIATGVFELLLAGGFLVGGFFLPEAAVGLWLTAAILGLTGLLLVLFGLRVGARAAEAERVDAIGLPGVGTVTKLTQTGMYLNENPQVEMELSVQVPGRAPYTATRKQFVPLILLSQIAPGSSLPVKVDPADPSNVIIDWDAGAGPAPAAATSQAWGSGTAGGWGGAGPWAAGAAPAPPTTGAVDEKLAQVQQALQASGLQAATPFGSPQQGQYSIEQLRQHVRATGLSGTATINQLQDSGQVVGDERMFVMQVTVNVPGRPPHQGPASVAMVPLHAAGKVAVGKSIPVKVAADNPSLVLFEWEKV